VSSRRPRYRIRQGALFWYLILTALTVEVAAALITHAVTTSRGAFGLVIFIPTFAMLGTITLWAGERWLPKKQSRRT
jgi:hypothetical protein